MAHLDDDRIVDLISGTGDGDSRRHLEGCAACAERLESWRGLLAGLGVLARESVGESELHRLRTMFRQLGPGRRDATSWMARLVRSTAAATVAVRGATAAELLELEAGPYTVLVQVTPVGRGEAAIHGQVLGEGATAGEPGTMVLQRDDGVAHVQELDDLGEFHVEPVDAGAWRVTWWLGNARIELDELRVGGGSDS